MIYSIHINTFMYIYVCPNIFFNSRTFIDHSFETLSSLFPLLPCKSVDVWDHVFCAPLPSIIPWGAYSTQLLGQ